jgi:hypothetical protein
VAASCLPCLDDAVLADDLDRPVVVAAGGFALSKKNATKGARAQGSGHVVVVKGLPRPPAKAEAALGRARTRAQGLAHSMAWRGDGHLGRLVPSCQLFQLGFESRPLFLLSCILGGRVGGEAFFWRLTTCKS